MVHGASSWKLAEQAGIDPQQIAAKREQRDAYYESIWATRRSTFFGVEDKSATVARTHTMAVVTTSTRAHFELIHRNRTLLRHMDFVLTREDYTASKPDPSRIARAARWAPARTNAWWSKTRSAACSRPSPLASTAPWSTIHSQRATISPGQHTR